MLQGVTFAHVFDVEARAGKDVFEFCAVVKGSTDGFDVVPEELVNDDLTLPQVRRDHQHAPVDEDST